MPFSAAFEDPILRTYALVVAGLLGTTAIILSILTWVVRRDVRKIWVIYRSWLWMIGVALVFVMSGRVACIAGVTLISMAALKEFARATGLYRDWGMTGAVYLAILTLGVLSLMHDPHTGRHGWYLMFLVLPVYAVAMLMMIPVLRNKAEGQVQRVSLAILGFIYIGWMFGHLGMFVNTFNPYGYLLFLVTAVSLNDIAAFTFGKLFGRHKLCSQISPNKTWEGAIGAAAVSMAVPWLLRFSFPHFGALQLVLTGLIVGIGGQFGDLAISFIKRDVGVKDMGNLLPGHGGVLDRVDSLIFTAPLFFHMAGFFYGV